MVTGTQVEEVPRTLISLDIPLTAAVYWVRVGGECPWHTVDVFQFCSWDRLLPFSGLSCWHCDIASAHLWPASDAPFLSTSFLELSTFTKCPCFTRSQVSGSTFPSLRTIQSNPWSWEPWTRYWPNPALVGGGWGRGAENIHQYCQVPTVEHFLTWTKHSELCAKIRASSYISYGVEGSGNLP